MKRREFVTFLGGAVAWPAIAGAQPVTKLRVGTASTQPRSAAFWQAFEQRMAERGYQEGKNYTFDHVYVPRIEEFAPSYQGLVSRGVDVIVAGGPESAIKSAIASTNTIPIVMVAIDYDPVVRGYVTNLARPTGNITGLFLQQIELTEKRLQLLKSAFPDVQAMTIFWDRSSVDQWEAAQRVAANLGLRLAGIELSALPFDYDKVLTQAPPDSRGTLFILVSPFFFRDRAQQAEFAARNKIVSMFGFREWADAGGLLSYGPSINGMYRRVAEYVDRIARGAKPADLPIEQPTRFELVINLKTAKAIGITIPPNLLVQAEEVIE
jgi:putative tryptophan/tyrosine transport system substrate-binding protein